MNQDQKSTGLLRRRRFLPLFLTQFLGATNDSLFKQALFILITFRLAQEQGLDGALLVAIGGGLFILPFFLFSATAGQLADKFDKSRLIRLIKTGEIAIMMLAAVGFYFDNIVFLMTVLFLMGAQSSFFGPVKYSILPDHLPSEDLVLGNAYIEAGTFLAILIGTIAGGLLILPEYGGVVVSITVVILATVGLITAFAIPGAPPPAPTLKINPNVAAETMATMKYAFERRDIRLSILGISWFWLFGATYLTQLSPFTRDYLYADEQVVTLFMTLFSIGIGIGSMLCNKLLKGEISARFVPFGAIGMAVFSFDLYFASRAGVAASGELANLASFLAHPANWRIIADLLLIAISGGVYIVPLYTIMQTRGDPAHRSRTIAANNILNALFMVVGAVAASAMLLSSYTIPQIFLAVACVTMVVAVYICGLLPHEMVKVFAASILRALYRVEVKGLENYKAAGDRAVIVVNHVSFLDGILLAAFLPGTATFAVNTHIAKQWWAKPFLAMVDAFPMDPTKPMAAKSLIKAVQSGKRCVIFPEGRITVTGSLMKVYEGPGMIADKAGAPIVPIRLDGAQFTPFSRIRDKVRSRLFPKITITVLEPRDFDIPDDIKGRARRQLAGTRLHDVMSEMIFATCDTDKTLFDALLDAKRVHGRKHAVIEDIQRRPVSYNRMITGGLVLGRRFAGQTTRGDYVGVLLPNSSGAAVTFFALQAYGRVPAMLNYSTGIGNMVSACKTAEIDTIITSRLFVRVAKLTEAISELSEYATVVYLEDLQKSLGLFEKLSAAVSVPFARSIHRRRETTADDPAVVLFTSGSEGTPKGVVLSHRNLLSNLHQLGAKVDFNPTDIVFNALPVFHSFGMTGGMLLPVLSGIKTFLYPSPLHYRIVPELVYDTNATIMFGTDTFLTGYARMAHSYDFYSVRYIFAGAEKVKDETRQIWAQKFGIRIFEGYGATETSPVLATNTPMHYRAGTVGRFLPGIRCKLEDVPGIEKGGRLLVSGPNVMLGYLRAEAPGVIEPPANGWYDTGDIVEIDLEGFVTIAGRAKRFAKIAGEMVSLTAAESHAADLWPEYQHAVVSVPDDRKGEALVLVTDNPDATRDDLLKDAQAKGIAELMVPKLVHVTDAVPLLGTGKIDYVGVQSLVDALISDSVPAAASAD